MDIMNNKFVNRRKELNYLRKMAEEIKKGRGEVILLEGPAGIGKGTLLEEFKKQIGEDYIILEGKCTRDSKYIPYDLFSRAFKDYGSLDSIKDIVEMRKIRDLADTLLKTPKMVLVNDVDGDGAYQLYREMRKKINGLYFTLNPPPDNGGIWLTETNTNRKHVSPTNMEFSIIPLLEDLKRRGEKMVFHIEGLNYLVYLNGIDRVTDFLQILHSISQEGHTVIASGKTEFLNDEETKQLSALFDEEITIRRKRETNEKLIKITNHCEDDVMFTGRRGKGDYTVGKGFLEPHRIDFELFDKIAWEISRGKNIVLDCLPLLIHYNGRRRIYTWLKAVADLAREKKVKLCVVSRGLSIEDIMMMGEIADIVEISEKETTDNVGGESPLKFYDTIFKFLDYEAKKKPLILLLENIQWSDGSSMKLLRYLARNIVKSRIMIVGTYRKGEIENDENMLKIIEEIQSMGNAKLIKLKPLSKRSMRKMFDNIDDEIFETIYEKSGGNPLLGKAILENMEKKNVAIPESIKESVEIQIDSLDDRTLYFLRFLSVLGEEIDIQTLEHFYPNYSKYTEKVKNRFIHVSKGEIRFIYSMYRDVLYRSIPKDLRADLHIKIGEFMEEKGDIIKAAYHYYMAGEKKAIKLLTDAAENFSKTIAIRNAIDYYEKALEIAEKYKMREKIYEFYEKMGDFYMILGEYRNAISMYEKSLKCGNKNDVVLGRKIGMCESSLGRYPAALKIFNKYLEKARGIEQAKLIGQIGIVEWHIGDFDSSLRDLNEYLKLAKKYGSKEDMAEAYRNMAIVHYYKSDYNKILEYARKSLKISMEIGDYGKIANSYNIIGTAYDGMYKLDDALKYYKKYLEISEKIGNFNYLSMAYNNIAIVYSNKGDVEKYRKYLLKSLEYNFKIGNKRDLSISYYNLARAEAKMGDYMKALEYMDKSNEYANDVGDIFLISTNYLNLSSLYMDLENYEQSEKYLKMALLIAEDENYEPEIVASYIQYASLLTKRENYEEAEDYLQRAEKLIEKLNDKFMKLSYLEGKIEYYIERKVIDDAENIMKMVIKLANEIGNEYEINYALKYMAKLSCMRNDFENAEKYYTKIIHYMEKMHRKKMVADLLFEYGKCLLKHRRNEAVKSMERAMKIYKEMNIKNMEKKVKDEISNL